MSYLELIKLASPEAVVVITALVVLAVGLTSRRTGIICFRHCRARPGWRHRRQCSCCPENANLFGGMLVITPLTSLFQNHFASRFAFFPRSVWFGQKKSLRHPGEYLAIILLATVGLMLLVGSEELLMIFIGLELLGLSLYVMAAFDRNDARSAEAGLKIFSIRQHHQRVLRFFGISLIYGMSGSTGLAAILGQIGGRAGANLCLRQASS